jgi:hypothetical protein
MSERREGHQQEEPMLSQDARWEGKYKGSPIYDVEVSTAETLERDPRYREMIEDEALAFLQRKDKAYFDRQFSGIGPDGYLLDKEGKRTNNLPTQNVNYGYTDIEKIAKLRFALYYPDSYKKYQSTEPKE